MRPVKIEEYEMKRVTLSQEQIWDAVRLYIKTHVVPPYDASVSLELTQGTQKGLDEIAKLTIEWADSSCVTT